EEGVGTGATRDGVHAATAADDVVASSTMDPVVAGAINDDVVTAVAVDGVVAIGPHDEVGTVFSVGHAAAAIDDSARALRSCTGIVADAPGIDAEVSIDASDACVCGNDNV